MVGDKYDEVYDDQNVSSGRGGTVAVMAQN